MMAMMMIIMIIIIIIIMLINWWGGSRSEDLVRDELIGVSKRLGDVRFDNYDGDDDDDNNDNNNTNTNANQLVGSLEIRGFSEG
jgi:hypothetical protein